MFDILLRRQCSTVLNPFCILIRFCHSNSALIQAQPKLKTLVEEDFSRVKKQKFQKHFIENLFLNKFQENVLEYPELDTIEEVSTLKVHYNAAQKLIESQINDRNALCNVDSDSEKTVTILKKNELSGFKLPKIKSGFGYLSSEYTFVQEALGLDSSLLKAVSENEDYGIHLIDAFGNDTQKEQYLLKLIRGENVACFAHLEPSNLVSLEQDSLNTVALPSEDNQSYIISGSKIWVYNAKFADVFILSANIQSPDGGKVPKPTLFLVDKNTKGIEIHQPIKTIGLKNLNICDVSFNKVVVPSSCVLGSLNQGGEIISSVLSKGKLNNGGHCIAIMKKFINKAVQHCIHSEFFKKDKYENEYYRNKVGHMVAQLYAVESMTYLLTGRMDSHDDADVFLESLIVKIFASESLQFVTQQTLEILGSEFFSDDECLVELSKDAKFYVACEDSNDYLRLILSAAGLKHAMEYKQKTSFLKDLWKNFSFKSLLRFVQTENDILVIKDLGGYLHKMFTGESWLLENGVYDLSNCTNFLIQKHGKNIFKRPLELKSLADIVINIYAMTSILARASRAYCVGVKLQEVDRACTEILVRICSLRLRKLKKLIFMSDKLPKTTQISSEVMNIQREILRHLISEIRILKSVDFEFLISLEHYFTNKCAVFLVIPYISGGHFWGLLRKTKKLDEDTVVLAFEYFHYMGIVYRDLKPENLLLDLTRYLKITDYEFAKHVGSKYTYTLYGTPEYITPEILLNKGYALSPDWCTLGILLYEMCNEKPPFTSRNELKLFEKIILGRIKWPEHFSAELKSLVEGLLQVDTTKMLGCMKKKVEDIKFIHGFPL